MQYLTLTNADMETLTAERVRALEADHFRARLRLTEAAEGSEQVEVSAQITDLERRIAAHVPPDDAAELTSSEKSTIDGDDLDQAADVDS